MPRVELIYDRDCPNVDHARANLVAAFAQTGGRPQWSEYVAGDADVPAHVRGYGSPTVLVEGRDVSGGAPGDERSCRVYAASGPGFLHVPPVEQIAVALANAGIAALARPGVGWWQSGLTVAPGVGAALVSTTLCPACWPALAGALSSLGIGFVMDARWVLPITIPLLALAAGAPAFRASVRRGYGPFALV
jgi:hypothetical protein